ARPATRSGPGGPRRCRAGGTQRPSRSPTVRRGRDEGQTVGRPRPLYSTWPVGARASQPCGERVAVRHRALL
ncbi:MAG: hypothetical protein AVDCRST_MAG36-2128, partial [uncultured Nocardioidaceae bacterium]